MLSKTIQSSNSSGQVCHGGSEFYRSRLKSPGLGIPTRIVKCNYRTIQRESEIKNETCCSCQRKAVVQITTGSQALDELLGGKSNRQPGHLQAGQILLFIQTSMPVPEVDLMNFIFLFLGRQHFFFSSCSTVCTHSMTKVLHRQIIINKVLSSVWLVSCEGGLETMCITEAFGEFR